ncbi:MAG: hypothetical protein IPM17_04245 [Verrucomicrobia bacterium]|nr:hypothetical protein [Verrucomicrobiota bacterium]
MTTTRGGKATVTLLLTDDPPRAARAPRPEYSAGQVEDFQPRARIPTGRPLARRYAGL